MAPRALAGVERELRGRGVASPRLSMLDEDDVSRLRSSAVGVLERTGARFDSAQARMALTKAGCAVDPESMVVRFPPDLVEWTLSVLRADVVLGARDPDQDVVLGCGKTFATSTGICSHIVDEKGFRREPVLSDLRRFGTVMDALEEVALCWFPFSPRGVPGGLENLSALACLLKTTSKHVQGQLVRAEDVAVAVEMLRLAAPGSDPREHPLFSSVYCPVSPLVHDKEASEAGMALAAQGIPIDIFSLPLAGATAPLSLAGTVVQVLAEELSAAVLFKLVNADVPLILSAVASIMDPRTSASLTASPEIPLMSVALLEVVHSFGAPALAGVAVPDADALDMRAGLEVMGLSLPVWLMRPDIAIGMGGIAAGRAVSLPKLVLDAEVLGYCDRVLSGIEMDAEQSAVDAIAQVGPGGHFLSHRSTRSSLRSGELWFPSLLRRSRSTEEMLQKRKPNLDCLAQVRIDEILASHTTRPLPQGASEAIDALLADAATERGTSTKRNGCL
jgi:trimethylamine--corrinoid protein Co-methyltransferase